MARNTCLTVVGVILALVGVGILVLGLYVSPKEIPSLFREQVNNFVVVDSAHSQAYDGWAGQNDVDNPYYMVIYMFNLTNVEEVIANSAVPVYEQVGPYMYRRYRKSVNVSFSDDGDLVQYNDFLDFYFDQNASGTLTESDMFTNINPVYVGGLLQAYVNDSMYTAEQNLAMAASGGMIKSFTDYLTGPFISLYTSYMFSSYFTPIMNANIAALNSTHAFVDIWRNGTTAPAFGNWTGMLLNGNTPANISLYSAQLLLDPAVPFSLLDSSCQAAWYWDQSVNNVTIAQNLTNAFQITTAQLTILWNWRNAIFGPIRMYPDLIAKYDLDEISDLGWVQWATETPLGGSVTMFPDIATLGFYYAIELDSDSASWREWRVLMDPNTGLQNITNVQAFLRLFGVNQNANFTSWGLTYATGNAFGNYVLMLCTFQAVPAITANMGPSGGLFVTKSVNQWSFNCDDYLLNLLQENPPLCSFRFNHSAKAPNTIHTGKSNIDMINTYTKWEGQQQVSFWQAPLNVSGFTELGQFVPDHSNHASYPVFQEDTARTVYLNYTGNITVEGINADRYILDFNRTFGVDEFYYQSMRGLANITSVQFGSPIFLSLWDMLYVDGSISNVTGLNATDEWTDSTVIDVEPVTGITVQCRRRMQVNVYVPPDNVEWFGTDHSGWMFGNENISSAKLRNKLAISPRVRHITFYIGVIAGPLFIVVGAVLIFVARQKRHHRDEHERLVDRH